MNEKETLLNERYSDYLEQIDKYYSGTIDRNRPVTIGMTTNALAVSGANENLKLTINIKTLNKCTSSPDKISHGHLLDRGIIEQLPLQLENPVMIFKNTDKDSLIAITDLQDSSSHGVIIAVALDEILERHTVNRISSIYGKDRIYNYVAAQIQQGNLIAVNNEKADIMFQSRGLQLPKEETYISYDDTIAYSLENVKYPISSEQYINQHISKFINSLKENEFMITDQLINNYRQLLSSGSFNNASLESINQSYLSDCDNEYIRAIGDELKAQELARQSEAAAALEIEP